MRQNQEAEPAGVEGLALKDNRHRRARRLLSARQKK